MPNTFTHLTQQQRDRIKALKDAGHSSRKIGRTLGIPHTTVSRELKRNSYAPVATVRGRWRHLPSHQERAGTYNPAYAQHKAYLRRRAVLHQRTKLSAHRGLREFVVAGLEAHWNPDEIAGYLKRHQEHEVPCGEDGCGLGYASKTTIYRWLTTTPAALHRLELYSQRRPRPKRYPQRRGRSPIPDRQPLAKRPDTAGDRQEPGHWEGDTVVSGTHTGSRAALAVVVERTSRLLVARLIPDLRPAAFAGAVNGMLEDKFVRTLSLDNGFENIYHQQITRATGATVYFTDPYSSWQKGGVENANKMLRRYIPKGSDLALLTQAQVDEYVEKINNKPRKILGYKSALQVAEEEGITHHPAGGAFGG
jgi:IS30 family transposase